MNKAIEQLAEQTGLSDANTQDIEKFAEELIKECMNAIFYSAQRADEYTSPKVFAKDVIVQLTEHYLS